jgi:hypothetical protein
MRVFKRFTPDRGDSIVSEWAHVAFRHSERISNGAVSAGQALLYSAVRGRIGAWAACRASGRTNFVTVGAGITIGTFSPN